MGTVVLETTTESDNGNDLEQDVANLRVRGIRHKATTLEFALASISTFRSATTSYYNSIRFCLELHVLMLFTLSLIAPCIH